MARRDNENDNLMGQLRQMSEEGITSFFNELLSNDKMRSSFGRAGERFMSNKQSFDRNVEQVLDFVNIPSKRDVRDLKARLDHLSSQLLNLSIKLDRLLDTGESKPAIRRAKIFLRGCRTRGEAFVHAVETADECLNVVEKIETGNAIERSEHGSRRD